MSVFSFPGSSYILDVGNGVRERRRSFNSFPCIHYSLQISASAPLPTVQGWDGLLCNLCLILGSLSNVFSKLLKLGLVSGSKAQQTVKVSWKKVRQMCKTFRSLRNMKCSACRECTGEEKEKIPSPPLKAELQITVGHSITTALKRDSWSVN